MLCSPKEEKRETKLKSAAETKQQKEKQDWDKLESWGGDEEKAASSSWEPHSEQGSEGAAEAEAEPEGGTEPKKRKRGHRGGKKHRKWWQEESQGKGSRSWENRWQW